MTDSYPRARCGVCRHEVRVVEIANGFYALIQHWTLARPGPREYRDDSVELRCAGSGQLVMKESLL